MKLPELKEKLKSQHAWGTLRELDVKPCFLCGRRPFGAVCGTGGAVIYGVPYRRAGRPVLRRRSGAAGPAGLDHMDTETVCLRRRRDDGAGAQDRPRAS